MLMGLLGLPVNAFAYKYERLLSAFFITCVVETLGLNSIIIRTLYWFIKAFII